MATVTVQRPSIESVTIVLSEDEAVLIGKALGKTSGHSIGGDPTDTLYTVYLGLSGIFGDERLNVPSSLGSRI